MAVRKTTIEIDDELVARVREILGTKGIKDTVEAALKEVRRREAARSLLDWLKEHGDELLDVRERTWRQW